MMDISQMPPDVRRATFDAIRARERADRAAFIAECDRELAANAAFWAKYGDVEA